MSERASHSYLQSHAISGEVLRLDFGAEAATILEAARSATVGHAAKTLVKEGAFRIVLLGMRAGSSLREHEAGGPISIHVLSGSVTVSAPGRREPLTAGAALVFATAVTHSVEADTDAVVLITIAWPAAQD